MTNPSQDAHPDVAPILERNIRALLERHEREEYAKSFEERVADIVTRFAGRMAFVYAHAAVFGVWIVINLKWTPFPKFDPTFVILAMVASVEAIFLSTFILISQNRLANLADRRADLDLQISLLAEHEITRIVHLVSAIARKLDLPDGSDPELEMLKRDVAPEQVLAKLDEGRRQLAREHKRSS